MFEEKLTVLKEKIIEYANHIEKMLEKAMKGLLNKDKESLKMVIDEDEKKANDWEIEIDELCVDLIALYQPMAKDLRTILMILKMNNDFERIADHVVNIAQSAEFLIEKEPVKPLIDIPRMADETTKMLKDALKAFIEEDSVLAKKVCERDFLIDSLRDQIFRELFTYMISDPKTIERAFHLIRITQNLERIADLSTNIGEDVIYIVEAKIIKHHKEI
ncbi:MAG: phosphate signaling complex protein PhoU [candidate division WOR-3 bacterium]|nr:phosphate signaling complex protein PhoU [candidate division WOR-3 bacterium]MCX7836774.1 phosphate signaling complex protein PhoU [candidate division WOR-3 bacterium]MDW8113588.1 phosphate signaling complex protein PhoU [candidate division WOR-3 bacterium]